MKYISSYYINRPDDENATDNRDERTVKFNERPSNFVTNLAHLSVLNNL